MEEEQSSSQSGVPVAYDYSAGEIVEELTLPRSEVKGHVLQSFLGYDSKWNDGRHVERTNLSITRLDVLVETVYTLSSG